MAPKSPSPKTSSPVQAIGLPVPPIGSELGPCLPRQVAACYTMPLGTRTQGPLMLFKLITDGPLKLQLALRGTQWCSMLQLALRGAPWSLILQLALRGARRACLKGSAPRSASAEGNNHEEVRQLTKLNVLGSRYETPPNNSMASAKNMTNRSLKAFQARLAQATAPHSVTPLIGTAPGLRCSRGTR